MSKDFWLGFFAFFLLFLTVTSYFAVYDYGTKHNTKIIQYRDRIVEKTVIVGLNNVSNCITAFSESDNRSVSICEDGQRYLSQS